MQGPADAGTPGFVFPSPSRWETLFELLDNAGDTVHAGVFALCAEITFALHLTRNADVTSHIVALETGGVGISVFSSIRRIEFQLWDEHLPSVMLLHETFARLFNKKVAAQKRAIGSSSSTTDHANMSGVVERLLNNISTRKTRIKCLVDISKLLQRCRTQSIYFLRLHVPASQPVSESVRNTEWFEDVNLILRRLDDCDHFTEEGGFPDNCTQTTCQVRESAVTVTVPTLTTSVVENILYGASTFPSTCAESELVAVLWMFVMDFHARPNVLGRMICHNTWMMNALVPMLGISLSQTVLVYNTVLSRNLVRGVVTDLLVGAAPSGRYFSLTSGETWLIIYAFFHGEIVSKLFNYSASMKGDRSMVDLSMSAVPVDRLMMKVNPYIRSDRHFRAQQRNRETLSDSGD